MGNDIFINQTFTNAINQYMMNKQNSNSPIFYSFPITVIKTLILIYGEIEIINSFQTRNENKKNGFNEILTKYGFSESKLQNFKDSFQMWEKLNLEKKFPNPYFITVEKYLIDMFCKRQKESPLKTSEIQNFQNLLYLKNNQNPIMQDIRKNNILDTLILEQYLKSKWFYANHNFKLSPYKKNVLIEEAYSAFGYTLETIANMDEPTLEELNKQIFSFFKIDLEDPERIDKLREAIKNKEQGKETITTGNGYVDMLLLLSVIATIMMILFAITVKVLGG